jgi:hypothetical protein
LFEHPAPEPIGSNPRPIGSAEKEAALVAMKHAELAERNDTYWIAAADPAAAYNAVTQTVDNVEQLAVLTDGAARVHTFGLLAWNELLDQLQDNGPAHIIQRIRTAESNDPAGQKWTRNKRSDDATIVYVRLAPGSTT